MSDFKRPLAFIALGLLLAALLVPFLIAALGSDELAVGFSIVTGLLALTLGAFSRSERLGLSVIIGIFLVFAFAGVFISIRVNHRRAEYQAVAKATADEVARAEARDNTIPPAGANDEFTPKYEITGRWAGAEGPSSLAIFTRQDRHVVMIYNAGGYNHVFTGDYVDDITVKGIQTRWKAADHTLTRMALTLTFLSPDRMKYNWEALDSNSDLAKGATGAGFNTRAPAESEDADQDRLAAPSGATALPPATPTASPAAYRPGNNGYLNFKFGMSLEQVFAALSGPSPNAIEKHSQAEERTDSADNSTRTPRNESGLLPRLSKAVYSASAELDSRPDNYDSLPIAGEYSNAVVRYYSVPMKSVAALRDLGGYSDSSALFFMFKNDKLFRISLRFLNDPSCQNHAPIYDAFVANNGAALRFLYGNRKVFRVDGPDDYLIGALSIDGVFMTFIQNNSPLSISENYNW
jgi:hypothetical protein